MASKARIWTHEIVLILPTNTRRISTRVVLAVRTEVAGDRCPLCVYLLYILCALRDPRAALKNAPHTSVTSRHALSERYLSSTPTVAYVYMGHELSTFSLTVSCSHSAFLPRAQYCANQEPSPLNSVVPVTSLSTASSGR